MRRCDHCAKRGDLFVAVGLLGTASLLGISTVEWTRRGSGTAGFKARGKVRLSLPNTGTLVLDPVLLACETGRTIWAGLAISPPPVTRRIHVSWRAGPTDRHPIARSAARHRAGLGPQRLLRGLDLIRPMLLGRPYGPALLGLGFEQPGDTLPPLPTLFRRRRLSSKVSLHHFLKGFFTA
ncbi:hypothetical protein LWI29_007710 [Acer saccharum]|uniref:Uncharacterized protein n=1 Tax=Acer saccharum TaxID=4024 RepID=A0AA39RYG9_ACESA|nr:hypothetical protein LWI29_007710 [Acer saccharum]